MTLMRPLALLFCITALACGRQADQSAPPAHKEDAPSKDETDHKEDTNVVTVEEGMLRDLRVTTAEVESRPGGERISLLGQLEVDQRAYAEVNVGFAARVTALPVQAGERVRAGQTLAELTSPDLGRTRAEYLSAQARVKLAESTLERKRGLAAERIVPLREVQEAESALVDAQAALRSARATIGAFGVDPPSDETENAMSSSFVLRSPVSGSVLERTAVLGQVLTPGTPAFRVGDLSTLWLTVHAFERDAVRIENGVSARLLFPALPGQDFQGRVTMVGREVERESRTVPVRIDVRNNGQLLRPGMSASAVLPVGATGEKVLSVPVAAVQRVRNEWCVFLPKSAGAFEIRRIGRGRDLGEEVEVLSGLRAGERIVVDGAFLLKAQAEKGEGDEHAH
jgi:cobalt-zinc-cadmium efflux system membrane fusion protein